MSKASGGSTLATSGATTARDKEKEAVDPKKKSVMVASFSPALPVRVKKPDHLHYYSLQIAAHLKYRSHIKVVEEVDGQEVNMTPKAIQTSPYDEMFMQFNLTFLHDMANMTTPHTKATSRSRTRSSVRAGIGGANKQSMDDLISGILYETINFNIEGVPAKIVPEYKPQPYKKTFVKVTLRKSDFFQLHSQISTTAAKGTPEGDEVEKDNRVYEYLTVGKGKIRRRSDNEAQTEVMLTTTRAANTILVTQATVSSYVSNFEMYDTVHNVNYRMPTISSSVSSLQLDEESQLEAGTDDEDIYAIEDSPKSTELLKLLDKPHFRSAIMLVGRTLSSNTNEGGMKRFRNFNRANRSAPEAKYNYSMKLLFRLMPTPCNDERKAVSDISFCHANGDILAVSYGLYSFSAQQVPDSGSVYIWSIKNPGEPERAFYYHTPVTAICFSPFLPSLIAVGLYDGSVEVWDVSAETETAIAVSERSTSPGYAPVVAIRWIKQMEEESTSDADIDPFLSLSQDGSVTRFRIIKSPYLLGFNQMTLERVEGNPEGIKVPQPTELKSESNRHPQGLGLTTHPVQKDIYYVLTDEGCIHKCSINYQHQYLEVLKCHDGGVTVMEFSPWSPKLFLTCGNDWYVRVWMEGITRPVLELMDEMLPVHWASWSRTHSTIIVAVNRETADIWDIKRNILQPIIKHAMDSSYNTAVQFSNCGRSLVVGNERGNTLFQAMNDMPFEPHFQYDELEKSLYKAICNDHDLLMELKGIGFFGYPGKIFVK